MKKLAYLLPFLALIFATGCRKDQAATATTPAPQEKTTATTPAPTNLLLGRWSIGSFTSSSRSAAGASTYETGYKGQTGDYYQFDEDGTLTASQGGTVYKCRYELAGGELTFLLNGNARITMHVQTLNATTLDLERTSDAGGQRLTEHRTLSRP